jgi:hypothetical protein
MEKFGFKVPLSASILGRTWLPIVLGMALGLGPVLPGARAEESAQAQAAQDPGAPRPQPATVRVTSSFDVKYAGAVLRQVAKLMHAGFLRREAEQVAHDIDQLPADQSRHWEFMATYKRVDYPLQIRARLDDFGMLDLDFFCAPPVAGAVRSAVDGYLNSRGL